MEDSAVVYGRASGCSLQTTIFVLFITFLALKLSGEIAWSWWWITAPLWIGGALYFIIIMAIIFLFGLYEAFIKKRG